MRLEEGMAILGLELPALAVQKLHAYADLIEKWNRVYNLTAIQGKENIVSYHLLDSLVVLPHLEAKRCADVGSGAGLPGVVLAIARPDWDVVLVESNKKKAAFLRQTGIELGLSNVEVMAERVENLKENDFDLVISRAFSEMGEFARLAAPLCAKGGCLAAMKGRFPEKEIAELPSPVKMEKIIPLSVPGVEGERHLVIMKLE